MAAAHLSSAWKAAVTLLAAQGQLRDPTDDSNAAGFVPLLSTESVQLATETYKPTLEVGPPPYQNVQGDPCVVPLGTHEFGFSYGTPWTTNFTAPACSGEYSVLYLKWEATCQLGVQFDRIAAVWINGVELLRTSTEEPDRKSGVSWEVIKDVTPYYDVVKRGGDVVVSLDNVIDGRYNSSFTITLSAEFYKPKTLFSLGMSSTLKKKPDAVVPVSKSSTSYGWFTVEPNSIGTNYKLVTLPRNTEELYLELFLSHHQCDEFYYTNPPDSYAKPLGWCGGGPFREVQVLIDGELVGVVWPFPLLFTGGLNPYLWRPIVAIGAFNAPTYVLNLTPFLEHFLDNQQHNVTFFVDYGIDFWPIDGNLLAYTDKYGSVTKSKVLEKHIDSHVVPTETSLIDGSNANFTLHAVRDFYVKSSVTTSKGTKIYTISQRLEYSNRQEYLENGDVGIFEGHTKVTTTQTVSALFGLVESTITHVEDYPIYGRSYYKVRDDGSYILDADLANTFSRSMTVKASPLDLLLPSFQYGYETKDVVVSLNGTANIDSLVGGNGTTTASYNSKSPTTGCFSRDVAASAGVLSSDVSSTTCRRSLRTTRP
uniref:Peptide N-acetyl-beta-D-glucosaminyl asparaginase amidase A N-terminal domain-containing protein n=1 Tax=Globisporangium ultimum (strain ATCC 200006 / CBS 805.95 / DAOM BR144) TaxID=431595 RepID=K3WDQ7_GLOUD